MIHHMAMHIFIHWQEFWNSSQRGYTCHHPLVGTLEWFTTWQCMSSSIGTNTEMRPSSATHVFSTMHLPKCSRFIFFKRLHSSVITPKQEFQSLQMFALKCNYPKLGASVSSDICSTPYLSKSRSFDVAMLVTWCFEPNHKGLHQG